MKPISLATFLGAVFMLGTSLLWFPDLVQLIAPLMPVGTPTWLTNFLTFLPFLTLSIILVALVIKMTKRGKPKGWDEEE
jgi:membrane protein implicated in regulation of membrane protease activity